MHNLDRLTADSPVVVAPCFTALPTGPNPPTQGFVVIYSTSVAISGDFGSVAENFKMDDVLNNMCLTVPGDGVQLQIQPCLNLAKNWQLFRMMKCPSSGTVQIVWDAQGKVGAPVRLCIVMFIAIVGLKFSSVSQIQALLWVSLLPVCDSDADAVFYSKYRSPPWTVMALPPRYGLPTSL
jgi:hypothetical protein